ncbi:MAG: extracellular solute-binding protein [Verrucomicrobiales bacterium]|nr:extracellular solute-binding protein [Verrucomicrobiales bacterium]
MITRLSIVFALLGLILVAPFALRPDPEDGGLTRGDSERLVIITPHNESIQSEFARAFARHMKSEHNRDVFVDWRQPGGTSEIARFLKSEYSTRFETLWRLKTNLPFNASIRDAFDNRSFDDASENAIQQGWVRNLALLDPKNPDQLSATARALFLNSEIGVGIDLFFGGGAYDFTRQASSGNLVSMDTTERYGPAVLAKEEPTWFDDVMPASVSGEPFRDPGFKWVGTVLSSFGIVYNTDVLNRLGFESGLKRWDDLADPRFVGQIALADPTKSGSTTKAFEMLIQEQIQRLIADGMPEAEAVPKGWEAAMRLIIKISANARYFTDYAAKVPRDVALGDAGAGMSIDFYGRTFNELYQNEEGDSHVQFLMPKAGTSIGADPIGMLRGAPHPELAHHFIRFVLSPQGQRLWNFRVGEAGGPERYALRRPPIRRDFYTEENKTSMSDPEVNPYEIAEGFTYHDEWTGSLFASLRFIIKATCIDPHEEQRAAWEHLIKRGMPVEDLEVFEDVSLISYENATNRIAAVLKTKDKVAEVKLARELTASFREKYHAIVAGGKKS